MVLKCIAVSVKQYLICMIKHPMMACSENILPPALEDLFADGEPLWVTDKLDGIRCLVDATRAGTDGVLPDQCVSAFSRSLIPLPNIWVQKWADDHGIPGMDGEIMIPGSDFNEIQSWVMGEVRLPINWHYHLFDWWKGWMDPYLHRMQKAYNMVQSYGPAHTLVMMPIECRSPEDVMLQFRSALRRGKEGLILRKGQGIYKQGRSTLQQALMLKMKQFEDHEAQIIGFLPEYENTNQQLRDELGRAKRSSHKAGKKSKPQLGAFLCRDGSGREFKVPGGTQAFKIWAWANRANLKGQWLTYREQATGGKLNGKPRQPIFKGIRRD